MANTLSSKWINREFYGFTEPVPEEVDLLYYKALLICAIGDGTISEAERDWILGFAQASGVSDAGITELTELLTYREDELMYGGTDTIIELLQKRPELYDFAGRALVRDAILACKSDGELSYGERHAIMHMADLLGLDHRAFYELEWITDQISELRQRELDLMFPHGRPF